MDAEEREYTLCVIREAFLDVASPEQWPDFQRVLEVIRHRREVAQRAAYARQETERARRELLDD